MNKRYITLFALILGLMPISNKASELFSCSCHCACSDDTVQPIAPAAAPQDQIMDSGIGGKPTIIRSTEEHLKKVKALAKDEILSPEQQQEVDRKQKQIKEQRSSAAIQTQLKAIQTPGIKEGDENSDTLPEQKADPATLRLIQNSPDALLVAIRFNPEAVTELLKTEVFLSETILNDTRSILLAVECNQWEILKLLIKKNVKPPVIAEVLKIATDAKYKIYVRTLVEAIREKSMYF